MHRFEQYLKILQLYHENSRFPPSFKSWSVSAITNNVNKTMVADITTQNS
jgi:hypothetical protein